MARDKILPLALAELHPQNKTLWISHLILMLFASLISGLFPLKVIGNITSIGTLLAFVIVCTNVLILPTPSQICQGLFKVPFSPFIPLAGITVCLTLMTSLEFETWLQLLVWLTIGLAIYFLYSRKRAI